MDQPILPIQEKGLVFPVAFLRAGKYPVKSDGPFPVPAVIVKTVDTNVLLSPQAIRNNDLQNVVPCRVNGFLSANTRVVT